MVTYKNIMELLVEEEVDRQCQALPSRASSYLVKEELTAFALNQLPPLYATSQQGLDYQVQRGRVKHAPEIKQAVQRAIAAVRRDPLRRHTPLKQTEAAPLNHVLQQMRQLLRDETLEWETLPTAVEQAIKRVAFRAARGATQPGTHSAVARSVAPASPFPPAPVPKPAVEFSDVASETEYGWDDPLYFSR